MVTRLLYTSSSSEISAECFQLVFHLLSYKRATLKMANAGIINYWEILSF